MQRLATEVDSGRGSGEGLLGIWVVLDCFLLGVPGVPKHKHMASTG
jgi:hypothetical protein